MKFKHPKFIALVSIIGSLFLAACVSSQTVTITESTADHSPATEQLPVEAAPPAERELKIVTLLPRDAIPAIDNPIFLTANEADNEYAPDEQVLGVVFEGEARAYSVALLSSHEIVNDVVGGRKIAVTW